MSSSVYRSEQTRKGLLSDDMMQEKHKKTEHIHVNNSLRGKLMSPTIKLSKSVTGDVIRITFFHKESDSNSI